MAKYRRECMYLHKCTLHKVFSLTPRLPAIIKGPNPDFDSVAATLFRPATKLELKTAQLLGSNYPAIIKKSGTLTRRVRDH